MPYYRHIIFRHPISDHILISEMISSENYVQVSQILRKVKFQYGYPLTTVSDLKPGFLNVSKSSFDKKVPHKFCDYHFLRTFKDDFVSNHSFIKTRLCKTWKVTSGLQKQIKSIEPLENKTYNHFKEIEKILE